MIQVIFTVVIIALSSLMFPSYAQSVRTNREDSQPSEENVLACTNRKNDKNPRLAGWQELIGRSRGEAEKTAFETNAEFQTVSSNEATITTKEGDIISISYGDSDQVIRAVCRSRRDGKEK